MSGSFFGQAGSTPGRTWRGLQLGGRPLALDLIHCSAAAVCDWRAGVNSRVIVSRCDAPSSPSVPGQDSAGMHSSCRPGAQLQTLALWLASPCSAVRAGQDQPEGSNLDVRGQAGVAGWSTAYAAHVPGSGFNSCAAKALQACSPNFCATVLAMPWPSERQRLPIRAPKPSSAG